MTRSKDRHSYDRKVTRKLTLSNGVKFSNAEEFVTPPRDWEGYLDRKGKDILWELEETNIPELQKVIETKGIYNK